MSMVPDLDSYFRRFVPPRDEFLRRLEEEAVFERIPIVGPVVAELLALLVVATGARQVLELGTATGYSAIYLARALALTGGRLLTVERDPVMAARAQANLERAGVADRVEVRTGEALKLLPELTGPFDFIFLDIDKEGYLPALPHCHRLLRPGGLLVADNVGFAAAADFNRELFLSPGWRSVPLLCLLPQHSPERDGLAFAVKVEGGRPG